MPRKPRRAPDTAPRLTSDQVRAALREHCAMRVTLPHRPSSIPDNRALYVVRFSSGLVKIGIASSLTERFSGLPSDASRRFPELDLSRDTITPVAVVEDMGRQLEVELLRELRPERVNGEWFRGPLADAVVRALTVTAEQIRRSAATGLS